MRSSFLILLFCLFSANTKAQSVLPTGYYYVVEKSDSSVYLIGVEDSLYLDKNPILTISDFKKIKVKGSGYETHLEIELNKDAQERFRIATSKWIGKKIAFVIDSKIIMAPIVVSEIPNGIVWISGGNRFTKKELADIKKKMEQQITETKKK